MRKLMVTLLIGSSLSVMVGLSFAQKVDNDSYIISVKIPPLSS